jgi:hypothetical protein
MATLSTHSNFPAAALTMDGVEARTGRSIDVRPTHWREWFADTD